MTDTTAQPVINAKGILEEAGDTLRMTYWITGTEFDGTSWDRFEFEKRIEANDLPEKHIKARLNDGGTRIITGVCSIGAMALAHHMHVDTPLENFGSIEARDWESFKAALVLVTLITHSDEYYIELNETPSSGIAAWNDGKSQYEASDRASVIAMFEQAAASPLIALDDLWVLQHDSGKMFCLAFATEEEANAAVSRARQVRDTAQDGDNEIKEVAGYEEWMKSMEHTGYMDSDLDEVRAVKINAETFRGLLND